jgi:hypothetical protein
MNRARVTTPSSVVRRVGQVQERDPPMRCRVAHPLWGCGKDDLAEGPPCESALTVSSRFLPPPPLRAGTSEASSEVFHEGLLDPVFYAGVKVSTHDTIGEPVLTGLNPGRGGGL